MTWGRKFVTVTDEPPLAGVLGTSGARPRVRRRRSFPNPVPPSNPLESDVNVKVVQALDAHLLPRAWAMYWDAFNQLNAEAVQRHLMRRHEFDQVMADGRVQKYLCFDDTDTLVGLATYTNQLDAVPLISPAYFARRWPDLFDEHRIWYCGFVSVAPAAQATGPFQALVESMWRQADDTAGVIVLDLCRRNADRGLAQTIPLMLGRLAGTVRTERLDEQSYWMYEFPGRQA